MIEYGRLRSIGGRVVFAILGCSLLGPIPQAIAKEVTIVCFRDDKVPWLSEDGGKMLEVGEVPFIGSGVAADYDNSGLVHFSLGSKKFVTKAAYVQLKPEAVAAPTVPPQYNPVGRALGSKGLSSVCPDPSNR